jgi:antitoxin CcdA
MNISQTVDTLLAEEVRKRYFERWNVDNAEAIAHYNARIEREGTLSQRIQKHLSAHSESEETSR